MISILNQITCCPYCITDFSNDSFFCNNCKIDYNPNGDDPFDFRLRSEKLINTEIKVGKNKNAFNTSSNSGVYNFNFGFRTNKDSFDFSKIRQKKAQNKLLSWIPKSGGIALDVGSYNDRSLINYTEISNHILIRSDYDNPNVDMLLDAHALPFKDNSIDLIINLALMEHVEFPHIVGREFYRVLKKDGVLLTNVAFLQQQHMSSWYHFTHYGVYSWLINSGFKESKIKIDAAGKKYHGIFTTASLIGVLNLLKKVLLYPIYFLHRILWKLSGIKSGKDLEKIRHLQTSGAINSVATK